VRNIKDADLKMLGSKTMSSFLRLLVVLLYVATQFMAGACFSQSNSSSAITGEFLWGGGLYQIGAHAAYDLGITGDGVTLAVIDTGVNYFHPELFTQIADGGYDFFNNKFDYMDYNGHGTLVSGIIAAKKDDYGIHGVAYNSRILPLKVTSDDGNVPSLSALNWALYQAIQEDVVAVNYSSTFAIGDGFTINDYAVQAGLSFAYTAFSGTIIVAAAGNSTAPNPIFPALLPYMKPENHNTGVYDFSDDLTFDPDLIDWSYSKGHVLAVVATDQSGVISDFSNRCGVAAQWCLAAPGEEIISTFWYDTYIDMKGTSLATPFVTGAVGLLKEMFPDLTNQQLVDLLLTTANKEGIYADESIYGQGFLDIAKAITPQGDLLLVQGDGGVSTMDVRDASIQSGGAFGDTIHKALSTQSVVIEDDFNRSYQVTLGGAAQSIEAQTLSQIDTLAMIATVHDRQAYEVTDNLSFTAQFGTELDRIENGVFSHGLWAYDLGKHALSFSHGDATRWGDGENIGGVENLKQRLFLPSYLDMATQGQAYGWQYDVGEKTHIRVRWQDGESLYQNDLKANSFSVEWGWADEEQGKNLNLIFGGVTEEDSLLGLRSGGALSIAPNTQTYFAGANAVFPLAEDVSLLGSFYAGQTEAKGTDDSLIQDVSTLRHLEWTVGVEKKNMWRGGDRVSLLFKQPLYVTDGRLRLDVLNANSGLQGVDVDLAPEHKEQEVHFVYSTPLPRFDGEFGFQASWRHNTGHIESRDDAAVLLHAKIVF